MKKTLFILFLPVILLASLQKVSVQLEWKHQFEFAGFYAAIEQGYYKDIGLEVELKEYKDNINISDDVINKKSTFGVSSSSLILDKLKNKPVVLMASYFKQNALVLISSENIKNVSDLKGKKIMALPYEIKHTSLGVMLKENNINDNDYTLVKHDFSLDKFINGEVDAMSIFVTNQPFLLDKKNINYNILSPAEYGVYSYDLELFTSEHTAIKSPKMVKNFIEATNKGWRYAFIHKNEIVDLIYKKYSKRKSKEALLYEAQQTQKLFKMHLFEVGAVVPELIELNTLVYKKLGLMNDRFDINSYVFNENMAKLIFTKKEFKFIEKHPHIILYADKDLMPIAMLKDIIDMLNNISALTIQLKISNLNKIQKKIKVKIIENKKLNLRFGIRKKWPDAISIINKSIQRIGEERLSSLKRKYFGEHRTTNNPDLIDLSQKEKEYLKQKKEIKICIDPAWMPFESFVGGKHVGMTAEYFKIFQERLNIPIRALKTTSWNESIEFAKKRKCDLFSLAMSTPKRLKYMNFTSPYLDTPKVLATKTDKNFITDFKDLRNKKIGIPKGYASNELLRKKYPEIDIVDVENIEDGLNKVKSGKLYGYVGTLATIGYMIQKEFTGELKIAGKFSDSWKLGIGVRNDDKTLFEILEKAVKSLSEEEKQHILNKWVSVKYEKNMDYTLIWQLLFAAIVIFMGFTYWNRRISRLNKELTKAKNKAEKAMAVKSDFIANVSHEIRTPMNSIVGMTYLVKQTTLSKVQKNYITKIEIASNNLLKLINDILDFSKMEAKKMHLSNVDFNLLELLDNVNNIAKVKADEKDLLFRIIYDKSKNMKLHGDNIKLSQILNNLISNAIKFTQQGFVNLEVEQISHEKFKFSITDTGIGLKPEQIDKLFLSFTQADESTTRKYGGTGLGLAITKELVHLMGGEIFVKSEYSVGSEFSFEINLKVNDIKKVKELKDDDTAIQTDKEQTKKILSLDKKENLFIKLSKAIASRRPNKCQPIIEEIELYNLNDKEQLQFNKIKKLVSQYKFNEAMEVLNEE